MHIEFHVSSGDPFVFHRDGKPRAKAWTEYVVLRLRPEIPMKRLLAEGRASLSAIDAALSRLPHLRLLMLETTQQTSHTFQLVERFPRLWRQERFEMWTHKEAYEVALSRRVQAGGSPLEMLPVSAIWGNEALRRHW